jgi:ComF family protein
MKPLPNRCRKGPRRWGEGTLFFLREYFFPAGCARCDCCLAGVEEAWYGLCENCRADIEREHPLDGGGAGERCDRCGRPLISEQGRCLSCRNGAEPAFDRIISLYPYAGKSRRLLSAYKFGQTLALGNFFAERIEETLADAARIFFPGEGEERALPETALVPVPPRPGKIKQSGWDQVEYLARILEKNPAIPVRRCLRRLPSQVQKELSGEDRRTNLRGRIILRSPPPRRAILIDDVMTTGSTLDACAAVLKAGGTEKVFGICLFYNV